MKTPTHNTSKERCWRFGILFQDNCNRETHLQTGELTALRNAVKKFRRIICTFSYDKGMSTAMQFRQLCCVLLKRSQLVGNWHIRCTDLSFLQCNYFTGQRFLLFAITTLLVTLLAILSLLMMHINVGPSLQKYRSKKQLEKTTQVQRLEKSSSNKDKMLSSKVDE